MFPLSFLLPACHSTAGGSTPLALCFVRASLPISTRHTVSGTLAEPSLVTCKDITREARQLQQLVGLN